jgi:hypothetical protein
LAKMPILTILAVFFMGNCHDMLPNWHTHQYLYNYGWLGYFGAHFIPLEDKNGLLYDPNACQDMLLTTCFPSSLLQFCVFWSLWSWKLCLYIYLNNSIWEIHKRRLKMSSTYWFWWYLAASLIFCCTGKVIVGDAYRRRYEAESTSVDGFYIHLSNDKERSYKKDDGSLHFWKIGASRAIGTIAHVQKFAAPFEPQVLQGPQSTSWDGFYIHSSDAKQRIYWKSEGSCSFWNFGASWAALIGIANIYIYINTSFRLQSIHGPQSPSQGYYSIWLSNDN